MKTWDNERKLHLSLGVIFLVIGITVSVQLITLTQQDMDQDKQLQSQISCNAKLVEVLRARSNARLKVDTTTIDAQESLVAVLEDIQESGNFVPNDPHLIDAIAKYQAAANARENPALSTPYVDCSGDEIK